MGVWYSQFNLNSNSWEAVVQHFMRDVQGNLVLQFSGEKYTSPFCPFFRRTLMLFKRK